MKFISLDPGGTTGICEGYFNNGELKLAPSQATFDHIELYEKLRAFGPNEIVCEDFEYRRGNAKPDVVLVSLELIGVVKLYSQQHYSTLTMQKASTGKGYFSDEKLRQAGIYVKGKQHARDATRHLMHWWTFGRGSQWGREIDYKASLR